MRNKITYKSFIPKNYIKIKNSSQNQTNVIKLLKKIEANLDSKKNIFNSLKDSFKVKEKNFKKYKNFKKIIVLGMGGSILGTQAIYSFLSFKIKKDFLFLDNLDSRSVVQLKKFIILRKTLFIIISKSGNTIETLINFSFLKNYNLNSKNTILITEDKDNALKNIAKKYKISLTEHRSYIGGRYSILSNEGMIPSYLMDIDIKKFKKNILSCFSKKNQIFLSQNALNISKIYSSKKINNLILFNYSSQLDYFMFWAQQLIAESLGKKGNGILPVISTGPKDHHSLLQLYLDGPKDKMFYIFSSDEKNKLKVSNYGINKKSHYLKNKTLNQVILAQKNALINVLKKKQIPFKEFNIKKFDEESLSELFVYFILETVLVGKLININPFDQPAVDQVKVLTRKFLS